jgi:hypothetical protein
MIWAIGHRQNGKIDQFRAKVQNVPGQSENFMGANPHIGLSEYVWVFLYELSMWKKLPAPITLVLDYDYCIHSLPLRSGPYLLGVQRV